MPYHSPNDVNFAIFLLQNVWLTQKRTFLAVSGSSFISNKTCIWVTTSSCAWTPEDSSLP